MVFRTHPNPVVAETDRFARRGGGFIGAFPKADGGLFAARLGFIIRFGLRRRNRLLSDVSSFRIRLYGRKTFDKKSLAAHCGLIIVFDFSRRKFYRIARKILSDFYCFSGGFATIFSGVENSARFVTERYNN